MKEIKKIIKQRGNTIIILRIVALFIFYALSVTANSQLLFQKGEFSKRREKLMEEIGDAILVIRGAKMPVGYTQFYQYNNLMYLTGVDIPDIVLMIDGKAKESYLFMTTGIEEAKAEGFNLQLVKDPQGITGMEKIYPRDEFTSVLDEKIKEHGIIYTTFSANELMAEVSREKHRNIERTMTDDEWDGRLSHEMQFISNLHKKYPGLIIKDCSPIIWDMRKIKSKAEIEIMRESGRIGVEAHKAVMKATDINVTEKYLANLFEFICKNEGASGLSYNTIIMSGTNHSYGHYHAYDRTLNDGDFIILDAGPDYKYYDVDISTTFPANGKFNKKQKDCYELALLVSETCIKSFKPGITLGDVGKQVRIVLEKNGYDPENKRYNSWYKYGGYNHSIGMAVHDGMGTFNGTDEILKPGFVFACDIMTRADSVTSVRIEDTVLITEDGCEVLSKGLPRSIMDIEKFMKK